jgi:hypothetical protein
VCHGNCCFACAYGGDNAFLYRSDLGVRAGPGCCIGDVRRAADLQLRSSAQLGVVAADIQLQQLIAGSSITDRDRFVRRGDLKRDGIRFPFKLGGNRCASDSCERNRSIVDGCDSGV